MSSVIIVILVFLGLAVAVVWLISVAVGQTILLAQNLQGIWDYVMFTFEVQSQHLRWLLDYLPGSTDTMFENMLESMMENIFIWAQVTIKASADYILSNTMDITAKVASVVVTAVVFVMATYFLTAEYPKINEFFEKFSGSPFYNSLATVKNASTSAFGGYIRSQLLLALLAFVVMFVALIIYGQRYSLLIAFFLAIIDLLPIIGTTAVLIPWGIICLLNGAIGKGVFLLVLSCSFFILRRFVEPKIVGSQTGISPFLALISIYLGMTIGGLIGAILGVVCMMVLLSMIKAGLFKSTITDIKTIIYDIKAAFWTES